MPCCSPTLQVSGSAWDTDLVKASGVRRSHSSQRACPTPDPFPLSLHSFRPPKQKYLAVNYASTGGGAFAVLPLLSAYAPPKTDAGKLFGTKLPDIMPLCRGHSAPV